MKFKKILNRKFSPAFAKVQLLFAESKQNLRKLYEKHLAGERWKFVVTESIRFGYI